jgi:hypothetical protein
MPIDSMDSLRLHLNLAMTVEHSTIPPYLCALYSIPDGTNEEVASVIRTVVLEEMLHMVLVANLTNAVGGTIRVNDRESVPTYPRLLLPGSNVVVELQKFSPAAIELFMQIERPDPSYADTCSESNGTDQYSTIGQFYKAVREGLNGLVERYGESVVFCGDPHLQVTPEYYYGGAGQIFEIRCLKDANRAIAEIVDQGEGLPGEIGADGVRGETDFLHRGFNGFSEPAHFFRFQEIHEGRYYQKGDTPATGPRGPEFPVDWTESLNMQKNPRAAAYAIESPIRRKLDEFNVCYTRLINRLQAAFTGQQSMLRAAVGDMYEIKQRATELMRIPNPLDNGATSVGSPFELTLN